MPTTSRIITKLPSFARAWNEEANEYQLLKQYGPSYIAADKSINEKANSILDPELQTAAVADSWKQIDANTRAGWVTEARKNFTAFQQ
jgi:hypothetical protein